MLNNSGYFRNNFLTAILGEKILLMFMNYFSNSTVRIVYLDMQLDFSKCFLFILKDPHRVILFGFITMVNQIDDFIY